MRYWEFRTRRGPFRIVPQRDGRFVLFFEEEALGSYPSAASAADDAGGGHHYSASCFPDDGETLGVSREIAEWAFVRP